jgi:phosphatidylinositol-3-phosphatase
MGWLCLAASLTLPGCAPGPTSTSPSPGARVSPSPAAHPSQVPHLSHVALVVLENTSYDKALHDPAFAALAAKGALLRRYYAVAHHSLPNYLALTSGATATDKTQADCPKFDCSLSDPSVATQLDTAGLTWQGYFGATTEPCRTPVPGQEDPYQKGYVTHHNPFAYYPALGANPSGGTAACQAHLRPLGELGDDAGAGKLPSFSMLVADSCEDGHDGPCADGRPGGIRTAGQWVTAAANTVIKSPAWSANSAFVIVFDESDAGDNTGCCGHSQGGGRVAGVVLSGMIAPGTVSDHPYDHYSLLRTIEDGLGLAGHLGGAGTPTVESITDVWKVAPSP